MRFTTLLVDLDETLYPTGCGVWEAIAARIDQYMHQRLGVPAGQVPALRQSLYQQYGTTLRGLQATRAVDTDDFLRYVHDIPLAALQPDPALRQVLLRYPQRRIIFTNADRAHAARVLAQLRLDGVFSGIIDIVDIAPYCKPMVEAFQAALRLCGESDPGRVVFLDDSPRNLAGARAAGMYTVQVGRQSAETPAAHARIDRLASLPDVLPPGPEPVAPASPP